ncbi:MAG: hypothetical protein JKY04_06045 [Sneathiella sp.]|nr:hypothetical protein [Sneathiella sp.]
MKAKYFSLCLILFCSTAWADTAKYPIAPTDIDYKNISSERARLGRFLFFDPILSGNKNIACATCHHPKFGTSDGISLAIGEGGRGLGTKRHYVSGANAPEQRIGRHSPSLFNLGASEFRTLFHDGRLEAVGSGMSGFRTPLDEDMAENFDGALSAQAMFPVLSGDEMAGHYNENEISKSVRIGLLTGPNGAWEKITKRVMDIPEYQVLFTDIYGTTKNVTFTDIANVIADFIATEFRADNSVWDQYLRDETELPTNAQRGAELFYGKANCVACHSGKFQTDHDFHAISMPQFGPGRNARFEAHQRDIGRQRVTGKIEDAYKFRTPSLRNVALTAPYGHTGAYPTLESIIKHHLDPQPSFSEYNFKLAKLPKFGDLKLDDFQIMKSSHDKAEILAANELEKQSLSSFEIGYLVEFLQSLTDKTFEFGRLGIPKTVPSGLPVD